MTADLIIPGQVLEYTHFSANELKLELAIYLYSKERLSIGQAQRLAGIDRIAFQKALSVRGVHIHFEVDDLYEDLETQSGFFVKKSLYDEVLNIAGEK